MAEFRPAGTERINAFRVGERYLFKHYFEDDAVFAEIGEYYDEYDYRFEVPAFRFEDVRSFLRRHDYVLDPVESPEEFAVIKRKYTNHPDLLFEESVLHRGLGNFNCFVMVDREAVERAVEAGARRLVETDRALDL